MRAQEITFLQLVQGEKQFQVPLYQRTYSWQRPDLDQLWSDILEQADALAEGLSPTGHFLGSVVLAPGEISAGGLQRWLVVDGQQRLTTLMLACCALRDHIGKSSPRDADRIHRQYLVNEFRDGLQRYRLLPTQADRPAYFACIDQSPTAGGGDNIGAAYRFFLAAFAEAEGEADALTGAGAETKGWIEDVIRRLLSIVEITAERGDNVHRIYESINNTGVQLSQTDLLRNYVFMLLPNRGERVYEKLWLPMQQLLGPDSLELLAWLDLVMRGDHKVKLSEVYREQQIRLEETNRAFGEAGLEAEIAELYRLARLFHRIVEPSNEPDLVLRGAFERMRRWGAQTAYPLALHVLNLADQGKATASEIGKALGHVESFFVRRMICGVPTNNLNRILNSAPKEIEVDRPVDEAVRRYLSGQRRYWPSDAKLCEAIRTKPFYWQGRSPQRFFVLRRLEEAHGAAEPVDWSAAKLTIEHVMPQTITNEWLDLLAPEAAEGEQPKEVHEALVHTLANLTLSAENARLSNHPFQRKQEILDFSALRMNQDIAKTASWGKVAILERADRLAELAVAIWPAPLPGTGGAEDERAEWTLMRQILAELPAGSWTTYGDVAEAIGSGPQAVGNFIVARPELRHAYRVLNSVGKVSPGFRWHDDRPETPQQVLENEGVTFDAYGKASPVQRMNAVDLLTLVGREVNDAATQLPDAAANASRRERFFGLLNSSHPEVAVPVEQLLRTWEDELDGQLEFGAATETSCAPVLPAGSGRIWPVRLYPSTGVVEVSFQYLAVRPPFDDGALRRELLQRINQLPGVTLPEAKLTLRPSFPLTALTGAGQAQFRDTLMWFARTVASIGAATGAEGGQSALL